MEMSNEEIYREWKLSKDPNKQISILADINGCSTGKIKGIIEEHKELTESPKRIEDMVGKTKRGRKKKTEIEYPVVETESEGKPEVKPEEKESGSRLPKSVVHALDRRMTLLDEMITFKKKEIEEAEHDLNEIKEFLETMNGGTA